MRTVAFSTHFVAFSTHSILILSHVQALVRLLDEEDVGVPAWISFTSPDGAHVAAGDPFERCVEAADQCRHVVAVGINCSPPRFILDLILAARKVSGGGADVWCTTRYSTVRYCRCRGVQWSGQKLQ